MKPEEKLKKAAEALKNVKYEEGGSLLSFFQARAKQVYEPYDLNDIEVCTIEIGFLWDFIDKTLGPAVGYVGLLDSFLRNKKEQQ